MLTKNLFQVNKLLVKYLFIVYLQHAQANL